MVNNFGEEVLAKSWWVFVNFIFLGIVEDITEYYMFGHISRVMKKKKKTRESLFTVRFYTPY
jgi:hypothetical protein